MIRIRTIKARNGKVLRIFQNIENEVVITGVFAANLWCCRRIVLLVVLLQGASELHGDRYLRK